MTIVEFLSSLREAKIRVTLEDGKLKINAPKGALNNELKAQLRDRKEELIGFLGQAVNAAGDATQNDIPVMPIGEPALASFMQQQLWFFQALYPSSSAYNLPFGLRMEGAFDQQVFDQVITEIFRRHESLRSHFTDQDGEALIVVDDPFVWTTPVHLISSNSPNNEELLIQEALKEEALTPFNLARGPMLRLRCLYLGQDSQKFVLIGCVHHIASDGWSTGILMREIAVLYASFSQQQPSPLPELSIQYKDYAHWQRNYLDQDRLAKKIQFWTDLLASPPLLSSFPTDHPRKKNALSEGAKFHFDLPTTLSAGLIEFSQKNNLTVFISALIAFQLTLWRYTRQDDLCIGMPVFGRNQKQTQELIGFFVGAAITRVDLSGNWTITELAEQVRSTVLQVLENDDLPLNMVLDALKVTQAENYTPIIQTAFQLQNFADSQSEEQQQQMAAQLESITQLKIEPLDIEHADAKFDMIVSLSQSGQNFSGYIEYNAVLYESTTVEQIFRHYQVVMAWMFGGQDQRINRLHIPTQAELLHYYSHQDRFDGSVQGSLHNSLREALRDGNPPVEILQLSDNQRNLFWDSVITPTTLRNNIGFWVKIRTKINALHLERAVNLVADKNYILRSAIMPCGLNFADDAYVVAPQTIPVIFETVDLSDCRLTDAEKDLYASAQTWVPHNLLQSPSNHYQLVKCAEDDYLFIYSSHHALLDGAGIVNLYDSVLSTYLASNAEENQDRSPDVFRLYPMLDRAEANTAAAQEVWRSTLATTEALDFVLNPVYKHPPSYQSLMPEKLRDYLPPGKPHVEEIRIERQLDPEHLQAIEHYCDASGIRLPIYLKTIYCLLIDHYCRPQEDFTISEILGGRNADSVQAIGCFYRSSLVVVAKRLMEGKSKVADFYTHIRAMKKQLLGAGPVSTTEQMKSIPQGRLTAIYNFYDFIKTADWDLQFNDITLGSPMIENAVQFIVRAEESGVVLDLRYDKAVFNDHDLLSRFEQISKQIIAGKQQVGELDFVLPSERKILASLAGPVNPILEKTIHQMLEGTVEISPNNVAVIQGDQQLTYQQLNAKANQLARYLVEQGVKPGSRIGVCLNRNIDFVVAIYAVLKAGCAYVPIDVNYPRERIAHILADAAVPVLISVQFMTDKLPKSESQIVFTDALAGELAKLSSTNLNLSVTFEAALYFIYTSGSTGMPKGAGVRHSGEANLLHWYVNEFGLTAADRNLIVSATGFDLTQKNFFAPMVVGAAIVLPVIDEFDDLAIADTIQEHQVTIVNCAPSMFYPLVEDVDSVQFDCLSSLRYVFLGGEAIRLTALHQWFTSRYCNAQIVNSYGPTECTDVVAYHVVDTVNFESNSTPIGKPIPNVQLHVLNDNLQPMPPGLIGEICVSGVCVGLGYHERPELTKEVFLDNPFGAGELYKVGDLGRVLPDGSIEFIGRKDFQVKLRGLRIELGEIEYSLTQMPQVKDSLVLVKDDQLIAYVIAAPNFADHDWRSFLDDYLPSYMVPAHLISIESWPLTPNGKIDRKALPSLTQTALVEYVAPHTETEQQLADIWAEVLQRDSIGIHDNFFELGGHSLLATKIVARVRALFNKEVPIRALFDTPTIAHLAKVLDDDTTAVNDRINPRTGDDVIPLSFAQQRVWLIDQLEPETSRYNLPFSARIRGAFDIASAQKAFECIQQRHEILRTVINSEEGVPYQRVLAQMSLPVYHLDLQGQLSADQEGAIQQRLQANLHTHFDLSTGPLFRLDLIKLSDQHHVIALNMHHIVFDGWSVTVLMAEFVRLYDGIIAAQAGNETLSGSTIDNPISADSGVDCLPALEIQYADFALWQRDRLQGELLENSLNFWQSTLHPSSFTLDVPTDFPRPIDPVGLADTARLRIDAGLMERFSIVLSKEGVTTYVGLVALYAVLLHRYSQQHCINIGTPDAARHRQELEGLIGFFVNTVIVPADFVGQPTFRQLLQKLKNASFDAFAHQDIPFEQLVDELQPTRDLSRAPLFQALFNLLNIPVQHESTSGFRIESLEGAPGPAFAKFDLDLSAQELGDEGLSLVLVYNRDLFSAESMRRFLEQYETLLMAVLADPDQPIQSYSLQGQSILPEQSSHYLKSDFSQFSQNRLTQAVTIISGKLQQAKVTDESYIIIAVPPTISRLACLLSMQALGLAGVCVTDANQVESEKERRVARGDNIVLLLHNEFTLNEQINSAIAIGVEIEVDDKDLWNNQVQSDGVSHSLQDSGVHLLNRASQVPARGEAAEICMQMSVAIDEPKHHLLEVDGITYLRSGIKARYASDCSIELLGGFESESSLAAVSRSEPVNAVDARLSGRKASLTEPYVAPSTDTQVALEKIWGDVLKVSTVGINDNFFELGGHSLVATQVNARIRRVLELELPLKTLFQNPTIGRLATVIDGEEFSKTAGVSGFAITIPRVKPDQVIPLSFAQQGLWFNAQLNKNDTSFNMHNHFLVDGNLDEPVLHRALLELVQRQQVLRTVFEVEDGSPFQRVLPVSSEVLKVVDKTGVAPEAVADVITDQVHKGNRHLFDLASGPLFVAELVRLPGNRQVLSMILHHSVTDGWSQTILLREILALYAAFSNNLPSPLEELPIQYSDFSVWQRRFLGENSSSQKLQWWVDLLDGAPPVLHLPLDLPRPAIQTASGAVSRFVINEAVSGKLKEYCVSQQLTPFMALLTVYKITLALWTNNKDIVVGIPVGNRDRKETEQIIGFFVNAIVTRLRFRENDGVDDLMQQTKDTLLNAFSNQDIPMELVFERLKLKPNPAYPPVAQVGFQLLDVGTALDTEAVDVAQFSDLKIEAIKGDQITSKLDMTMMISPVGEAYSGLIEYNTDLFKPETMLEFQQVFVGLLTQILEQPDISMLALNPLNESQLMKKLCLDGGSFQTVMPMASVQRDLYLGSLLDPATVKNSLGLIAELKSELDETLFKESIQYLVSNQKIFRTRLRSTDVPFVPAYYQATYLPDAHRTLSTLVQFEDYRGQSFNLTAEREAFKHKLIERFSAEIYRSYDVNSDEDLCFFKCVNLGDNESIVVMGAHHAVLDGISFNTIGYYFTLIYEAKLCGTELPKMGDNYLDHVNHDRQLIDKSPTIDQWQELLVNHEPLSTSSSGFSVEAHAISVPVDDVIVFGDEHWSAVKQFSKVNRVNPPLYLKALYGVLIQAWCRPGADFSIFEISSGLSSEMALTPGVYYQQYPFLFSRDSLQADTEFPQLLKSLRQFQRKIKSLKNLSILAQRRLVGSDGLQFMFNYNPFLAQIEFLGETINNLGFTPDVDDQIQLLSKVVDDKLHLNLHYHTHLFTDQRFLQRLESLSLQVIDGVDDLAKLNLLLPDEEKQLDRLQVNTEFSSLIDLLAQSARINSDAVAITKGDTDVTYSELEEQSNQLAVWLLDQGVQADDYVAVCLDPGPGLVVSLWAILKAQAVYVPIDTAYPSKRISYILKNTQAKILLAETCLEPVFDGEQIPTETIHYWPNVKQASRAISQARLDGIPLVPSAERLIYVIYTSGSTGNPKGAAVYLRSVSNLITWYKDELLNLNTINNLIISSTGFDLTQKNIWGTLSVGGTIVFPDMEGFDDTAIVGTIESKQVSVINCAPSAFYPLLELCRESEDYSQLASVQRVILGGEPIQTGLFSSWLCDESCAATLVNSYGPTECADIACYYQLDPSKDVLNRLGSSTISIGSPNSNVQLYVMDSLGRRLPHGIAGELYIGGVGVGAGYLGLEELNATVFIQHQQYGRLYRTGDLVKQDECGLFEFLCRIDYQVKVRGLRIELGEIEFAMREHARVDDAIVMAQADTLIAYVLINVDSPLESGGSKAWRDHLADYLPSYMIPTQFIEVERWPLTPNGKVDRSTLMQLKADSSVGHAVVAPRNDVEATLVQLWQEVLQKTEISVHDSFFDLGGHSLLATKAISRVRKSFNVDLSLRALFDASTVAELALVIEQEQAKGGSLIPPLLPIADKPALVQLSFYQQGVWFTEQMSGGGSLFNMPISLKINGDLDSDVIDQVLQEIIRRHESLRTVFEISEEGNPSQKIKPAEGFSISKEELSGSDDEIQARVEELIQSNAQRGFDLQSGPLFRVTIATALPSSGKQCSYLFACMHHIISDAVSISILMRELAVLYVAFSDNKPSPLPELPIQYADFALWQHNWMKGDILDQQLDYWLKKLHKVPQILPLPTDRPRPEFPTRAGATHAFEFTANELESIVGFSREQGVTPFVTLLMSCQLLLARYANQSDVSVAIPVAGRNHEETEGLIGYFINTLVMRTDLSGNPTVGQLVARVKETVTAGFAHQELPVEKILEALGVDRATNFVPITQVAFQLMTQTGNHNSAQGMDGALGNGHLGALEIENIAQVQTSVKNDLVFSLVLSDDSLRGTLSYSSELFDSSTIERLVDNWMSLVSALIVNSQRPIDAVDLVEAEQRMAACSLNSGQWESIWPLTAMQTDQYLDSLVNPHTLQNSHGWAIHLHTPLNVELWRYCLQCYYNSQPVLRSRFVASTEPYADVAYQAAYKAEIDGDVNSSFEFPFDYQDLSDQALSDKQVLDITNNRIYRPYDVTEGSLVNFGVLKIGKNHFVVLASVHHGILDGGALNALWVQVTALYEKTLRFQPEIHIQGVETLERIASSDPVIGAFFEHNSVDFAQLDREVMDTGDTRLFWQTKLANVEPLNFTVPAPVPEASHFVTRSSYLSDAHWQQVKQFCRAKRITPALYFKCLYGLLIDNYCSPTDDFLIQETMSGRTSRYEFSQGCFIQEIPFVFSREALNPDNNFDDVIAWAKEFQKSIKNYRSISIGAQTEIVPRGRIGFMFNFYQFLTDKTFLGESINPEGTPSDPASNVQFVVTVVGGKLKLDLFYHQHLFCDLGFLQRIESLSHQVLDAETIQLKELQWVSEDAERLHVLNQLAGFEIPYDLSHCLHQRFEMQVDKTPDEIAVVFNNKRFTYAQLNVKANQLAGKLVEEGVQLNSMVGLFAQRSDEFLVGILGILKAGAAYVPMDASYPEDRISYMIADSQVAVVLTQKALLTRFIWPQGTVAVCLDDDEVFFNQPTTNLNLAVSPLNTAYMIYTSGSTGQPKGAMVRHNGALNHIEAERSALSFSDDSSQTSFSFLQTAPASSDISVWQFLGPLTCGGKVVVLDEVTNVEKLHQLIVEEAIDLVELVPVVLQLLIDHLKSIKALAASATNDLRHLKWMIATGEAVSVELVNQWLEHYPNIPVVNAYGPTEAADDVIQAVVRESLPAGTATPIGRPLANMAVYILDEQLRLVPPGVPGEICVAGVGVGSGYWNKAEKTAEVFRDNPYSFQNGAVLYRTGDLGRWLPSHEVDYLGRIDNQVKIRGFRIELGEIEATVLRFTTVKEVVVITRDDLEPDACLVAYYTGFGEVDAAALRSWLSDQMPDYMVPRFYRQLDQLPLNPAGKVDRKALPKPSEIAREIVLPRTELEIMLHGVWQDVMGLNAIGVTDDFFEIGGHSLLAVRLMARIKQLLDVELPLATLFQAPTIADLAQQILLRQQFSADELGWDYIVPLKVATVEPAKSLFLIHPVGGEVMLYLPLALELPAHFNVFGVQAKGLMSGQTPLSDVESAAAEYVAAIRAQQPSGPYLIAGQSLGGILALEVVRGLELEGCSVSSVHLLDTYLPSNMRGEDLTDLNLIQQMLGDIRLPLETLEGLNTDELIDRLVDLAEQFNLLPDASKDLSRSRIVRMVNVAKASHEAVMRHTLAAMPKARVFHYAASEGVSWGNAADGWSEVSTDVAFEVVEGSHESILKPPQVASLVEKIVANLMI